MTQYVGILDGRGDVWGIRIPDVPGCYGAGGTPEDALADAISALREVAAHLVSNDNPVPTARGMESVRRDKDAAYDPETESMVMVPLLLDKARVVKANVSLDAGTLEAIDEEAERRGLTRSSFLASAAVEKIATRSGSRWHYNKTKGGTIRVRSEVRNPSTGAWKRDDKSGKFMDVKADKKPSKSVRKGKGR